MGRVAKALRYLGSVEGLVATFVGSGLLWLTVAALGGFLEIPLGYAVAGGVGAGFLALAIFVWSFIRPRREQRAREDALRVPKLKLVLVTWAEKGELIGHTSRVDYPEELAERRNWEANLRRVLKDTLGQDAVDTVFKAEEAGNVLPEVRRLRELIDDVDLMDLRDFEFEALPTP